MRSEICDLFEKMIIYLAEYRDESFEKGEDGAGVAYQRACNTIHRQLAKIKDIDFIPVKKDQVVIVLDKEEAEGWNSFSIITSVSKINRKIKNQIST